MMEEEHARSNENAELIRRAYEAYASGVWGVQTRT